MSEVNELIRDKLQKYPEEVKTVALEVVKNASEMTEQALREYIEMLLRKTIRARRESQ